MDGRRGVKRGDRPAEERRRAALIAFMRAGSPSPPSTALLVAALAGARRPSATREGRIDVPGSRSAASERTRAGSTNLGNGRSGPQRSIGDPQEIPRGTHPVERRLAWGVISGVDLHGCYKAVEVNRQGWPGHLDRYRVAHAN